MKYVDFDWVPTASDAVIARLYYAWYGTEPSKEQVVSLRQRFSIAVKIQAARRRAMVAAADISPIGSIWAAAAASGNEDGIVAEMMASPEMQALLEMARIITIGGAITMAILAAEAHALATNRRVRAAQASTAPGYYYDKSRVVFSDLIAYADAKIEDTAPPPLAVCLPRTALAVFNASGLDQVRRWRHDLAATRNSDGRVRDVLLARLHRAGCEILAALPADLGRPEPGPPRSVWPPAPPTDDSADDQKPPSDKGGHGGGGAPPPRPTR